MNATKQQILLRDRLQSVQEKMGEAALRAQRDPANIRLVAVSKYTTLSAIKDIVQLEQLELGESKPQQLVERAETLPKTIHWHMIGNLQRNKVQQVLRFTSLIHAVDSVKLMERIEFIAGEQQLIPDVLLEVNISGETSKHGFTPQELEEFIPRLSEFKQLHVMGLMTMAPYSEDQESTRPVFRKLRELRDKYQQIVSHHHPFTELSMGMSNDYEVAIEEGATYIRLGSTLFEGLPEL
jgi:pyridoxal phosphate enzyme (YggS family)